MSIKKLLSVSAVVIGGWFLFGHVEQASAAVTVNRPTCAYEANNFTVSISWTTPNLGSGYIVDISTTDDFYYVWNKNATSSPMADVPNGFVETKFDGGSPNPTATIGLVVNTTYYVRVFNYGTHDPNLTPGVSFIVPECAPPNAVSVSGLPTCLLAGQTYNSFNMSWAGGANPAYGYFADISDNNFARHWTKNVPSGTTSTTGISGFNGYSSVSGPLPALEAGQTYYARVFNGEHSLIITFRVPICSPISCTGAYPDSFTTYEQTGNHTINVMGVSSSVSEVRIAIWSTVGGDSDRLWYVSSATSGPRPINMGGGTWRLDFDYGAHPGMGSIEAHAYMYSLSQPGGVMCDTADFTRALRPAPTAPVITSTVPDCTSASTYSINFSWTGSQRPTAYPAYRPYNYTGFIVDVALDAGFTQMWNKYLVYPAPTSTSAGAGFAPYSGVSGALALNPGTTYHIRVYNDSHSPVTTVNVPRCGSLNIEAEQPGLWILYGPGGYTTSGTGSTTMTSIPVGAYTLAPQPNSPAGYTGTAAPTTLTVP